MNYSVHRIKILREIAMPLLKWFGKDIEIAHPWIKEAKVFLHSFKHKGYWYHGVNREIRTMKLFRVLIKEGFRVTEVGGHIGFISMYFSWLVGEKGKVIIFEPGSNNLPYIRKNIDSLSGRPGFSEMELIEKAVGDKDGESILYEESLTGQNNSLVKNFKGLEHNVNFSYVKSEIKEQSVSIVSLDSFLLKEGPVDFIKIDVEGFEFNVLMGALKTIQINLPIMMVEVQANQQEIFEILKMTNYSLFNDSRQELIHAEDMKGNIFCLHTAKHREIILENFRAV